MLNHPIKNGILSINPDHFEQIREIFLSVRSVSASPLVSVMLIKQFKRAELDCFQTYPLRWSVESCRKAATRTPQ